VIAVVEPRPPVLTGIAEDESVSGACGAGGPQAAMQLWPVGASTCGQLPRVDTVEVTMRGRESFEEWARARQQRLVGAAYLMTGDYQRAEDLVQEAFIRAAMRWDI